MKNILILFILLFCLSCDTNEDQRSQIASKACPDCILMSSSTLRDENGQYEYAQHSRSVLYVFKDTAAHEIMSIVIRRFEIKHIAKTKY